MRINRNIALCWLLLTGGLALVLPALNLALGPKTEDRFGVASLYSTDVVEGAVALACYRAGVSWDPQRVVVGKEGWLFLGDQYEGTVRYTQGIETPHTSSTRTEAIVRYLQETEAWLAAREIPMLFVIAPNKYTVYPEYKPDWMKTGSTNLTDAYVDRAAEAGLSLLDLRPEMVTHKDGEYPLYFKLDSHWNQYGAYLGYRTIVETLNARHGLELNSVDKTTVTSSPRGGGGTSNLLKLNPLLGDNCDVGVTVAYDGMDSPITVQRLNRETRVPVGESVAEANHALAVGAGPYHMTNEAALNDLRVLWLRDSFGNYNSRYFHATFREVWATHLADLYGPDLARFIEQVKPDLVLYQVVERSIHGDILRVPIAGGS